MFHYKRQKYFTEEGKTALRTGQHIVMTATKVSKWKLKGREQSNVEEAGNIPLTKKGLTFQDQSKKHFEKSPIGLCFCHGLVFYT